MDYGLSAFQLARGLRGEPAPPAVGANRPLPTTQGRPEGTPGRICGRSNRASGRGKGSAHRPQQRHRRRTGTGSVGRADRLGSESLQPRRTSVGRRARGLRPRSVGLHPLDAPRSRNLGGTASSSQPHCCRPGSYPRAGSTSLAAAALSGHAPHPRDSICCSSRGERRSRRPSPDGAGHGGSRSISAVAIRELARTNPTESASAGRPDTRSDPVSAKKRPERPFVRDRWSGERFTRDESAIDDSSILRCRPHDFPALARALQMRCCASPPPRAYLPR
jgi:hypothetical protein